MKIAFYAPMNAPDGAEASGDRALARLFRRALSQLGHEVTVATRTATYAATPEEQRESISRAQSEASTLIARLKEAPDAARPQLWFTYHVYYRAPDVIGPRVAAALGIPYVIAEASDAPKHRNSPWRDAYCAAHEAIAQADRVFALTAHDRVCLAAFVAPDRLIELPAFIDAEPFRQWRALRTEARTSLAVELGASGEGPLLLTVAMMRQRKKLDSYRMLARALAELLDRPWSLVIVGDGPARGEVEAAFAPLGRGRVHFLGARPAPDMPRLYGACDLYVWPGVEEAFGLAFLEAQATARPALAQRTRGIPSVVEDGGGGLLTPPGDLAAFVAALRTLLADGVLRESLGARGAAIVDSRHTIERAGAILARELGEVCA